jgi:hypothetical protein
MTLLDDHEQTADGGCRPADYLSRLAARDDVPARRSAPVPDEDGRVRSLWAIIARPRPRASEWKARLTSLR